MQAGIIGLPGSGKTTVFRALTALPAGAESGGKGKLVRGVVKVPDARLLDLKQRYNPKKYTPAEVVFTDLPGPGQGDGGEHPRSISPRFVGDMRAMDLLVHVVADFTHPSGQPSNPVTDLRMLIDEMILQDLEVVEKRLKRLRKGEKGGFPSEKELLEQIVQTLEGSGTVSSMQLDPTTTARLGGYAFLTSKPQIVVLNRDDEAGQEPVPAELLDTAADHAETTLTIAARLETELTELDPDERDEFMQEMGIETAGTERFILTVYEDLGLCSFFTTGEDEVRAWTVKRGTTALIAAGRIHTDLMRGFIRADVVGYDDLVVHGDEAACRKAGKLRQEGRDYVVLDGDIINVKFNV